LVLFLKILGGVVALALGIYLGGGSYTQSTEEVAARLGKGQPRKAKRHFMWLNYLKTTPRASQQRRRRQYFKTVVARGRPEKGRED